MHNTQREIRVRVARGPARFRCGCAKVASFGESRVPADQSHRQWEEGIDSRSDVRTATTLPIPTTCLYPLPCFTARKYEHLRKTKILGVLNKIKGCTIVLLNTVQHRTNIARAIESSDWGQTDYEIGHQHCTRRNSLLVNYFGGRRAHPVTASKHRNNMALPNPDGGPHPGPGVPGVALPALRLPRTYRELLTDEANSPAPGRLANYLCKGTDLTGRETSQHRPRYVTRRSRSATDNPWLSFVWSRAPAGV